MLSILPQSLIGHKETITITSLTPVYLGLAGTALAAMIAAYTSWRTSIKASKTARKVAKLSRQSAQELKDKEYKNDYYKKVIDKRMKSLEFVTQILSKFIITNTIEGYFEHGIEGLLPPGSTTSSPCYAYFIDNVDTLDSNNILLPFDESEAHNLLWCSTETGQSITNLMAKLVEIVKDINAMTPEAHNRIVLYSIRFEEVKEKVDAIERSMVNELKNLYDIEDFLVGKSVDAPLEAVVS